MTRRAHPLAGLFGAATLYALAAQTSAVVSVIALPIVTPHLTAADFGYSAVVLSYAGLFAVVEFLGLPTVLANAFIRHPLRYEVVFRGALGLTHLWSVVYYSVLGALLWLVVPAEIAADRPLIIALACGPGLLLGPIDAYGSLYYQLRKEPQELLILSVTSGVLAGAVLVTTVNVYGLGYLGFLFSYATGLAVRKVIMHYKLTWGMGWTPIFRLRARHWWPRLRVSLPVMPHYYGSYLLASSDKVVMERLSLPAAAIGLYDAASKFGQLFNSGAVALNKAVAPYMLEAYGRGDIREAGRYAVAMQLTLFASTFAVSAALPELFPLLIRTPGMEAAVPLCIPVIMAYNYRGMYVASTMPLFYHERTAHLWKVSLVAGVANVALNFVLIPRFGVVAAAWTTFGCLLFMGYGGFALSRALGLGEGGVRPWLWLLATLGLTALALYLAPADLWVRAAATAIIAVPAVVFAVHTLSQNPDL